MEAKTNGFDSMEANTNGFDPMEAMPKLTTIGTDFEPNDNWLRFDRTDANLGGWVGKGSVLHFSGCNHLTIDYN